MTRKYGKKTSEKVARTMREFKAGTLKSGSGGKVTSRKQAIAIGLSQARSKGYKVPSQSHASMSADEKVRAYLERMRHDQEIDVKGISRALRIDPWEASYALDRAVKSGFAVTDDGRWFGPASGGSRHHAHHATKRSAPRIAYWIRSRGGPRSEWDVVPIYVLGTTTRSDEGIVGHDLRVRPLRLGKGAYTVVVSPDDVEDEP